MQGTVQKGARHRVGRMGEMVQTDGDIVMIGQPVLDFFVLCPAFLRIGQGFGRDQVLVLFHPWHMGIAKDRQTIRA